MTDNTPLDLEALWDRLLSREPELIRAAFASLAVTDQAAVLQHLRRMAGEDGWHSEQRISAETALQFLQNNNA